MNDDRFFLSEERVVERRRENLAEFAELLVRNANVSPLDMLVVGNEPMDVPGPEQYEIAGHKRIIDFVDNIYAGSVDSGSKFPVAVAVQNAVVVPQKKC